MKKVLVLIAFTISLSSFGNMEHKNGIGTAPQSERLSFTRSCFKKAESAGCNVKDQEFRTCLIEIKEQLDQECKSFFYKLYKI